MILWEKFPQTKVEQFYKGIKQIRVKSINRLTLYKWNERRAALIYHGAMTPSAVTGGQSAISLRQGTAEDGDSSNKASDSTKQFLFTECIILFLRLWMEFPNAGRVDQSGAGAG